MEYIIGDNDIVYLERVEENKLAKKNGEEEPWSEDELHGMYDMILPVPVHPAKKSRRGYNQAEVIAAELAERLSLPLYARFLRRNRYTPPQKALNNHERIRNLCRALEPGPQAKRLLAKQKTPRRVLLVDDIYTTGSTLEACSLVLKTAGVEHIMVATVCIGSGYA